MIDCPNGEVRDLLPDYLHDRLESSARMSVERHLAELRGLPRRARAAARSARDAAACAAHRRRSRRRGDSRVLGSAAQKSWASGWRIAAAITVIAVGGTSIALLRRPARPTQVARNTVAAPTRHAPAVGPASLPPVVQEPVPQPEQKRGAARSRPRRRLRRPGRGARGGRRRHLRPERRRALRPHRRPRLARCGTVDRRRVRGVAR